MAVDGTAHDLIASDLREAVTVAAGRPVLLVCSDFDGTLAPLAPTPDQARPLPEGVAALAALAALPRTTAALVSGRSLDDLAALSDAPPGVRLVGSHGWEFDTAGPGDLDPAAARRRDAVRREVAAAVDGVEGVLVEPKATGVAVHVRLADRADAARVLAAVREGAARRPGVHLTAGHEVLELSVVEADKGHAVDVLRAQAAADAVVFVGDDVTDERAFARLHGNDVAVKVGPGSTAAPYRVDSPRGVVALLVALLHDRRRAPAVPWPSDAP